MADSKISALSAQTTLASTDMLLVANSGSTTKKITGASLLTQMPGYEFHYKQITSDVVIASTTESAGTTVITADATTFDGSPVICEFFSPSVSCGGAANANVIINLFEGATQIGRLAVLFNSNVGVALAVPVLAQYRFTPTAASHTYTVTAYSINAVNRTISAGGGGTSTAIPAYVRFIKV